ncbi:hypothetical protein [Planctomicrobium sp. SH664]|uniref:hypothetical protein n=1 Tax=Planctomicrobium sp. SH664 TaxID=3448125 RepID=UPI003F5CAAFE
MHPTSPATTSGFLTRPASTGWEALTLPELPQAVVWVWFKPPQAPQDLVLQIPDETYAAWGNWLTLRRLLAAAGIDPREVHFWVAAGLTIDALQGQQPWFDQPLPPRQPWGDPTISIRMVSSSPSLPAFESSPAAEISRTAVPADAHSARMLAAIDADWKATLLLESQLTAARKQLSNAQGRLQSMSRELTTEEAMAADSLDKKDWQDARRFLRDAAAHVSRYIREFDIGFTSAAGQRNRFEEIYREQIVPQKPFAGLAAAAQEFETYRKINQSLLGKIQTVLSNAGRDGEMRAQQVLSRIAAKIRKSKKR